VSTPAPSSDGSDQSGGQSRRESIPAGDVSPSDQERTGDALRAAFARLAPLGSNEWNFDGAFTQLLDKYGPDQPGAATVADAREQTVPSRSRLTRRLGRRHRADRPAGGGHTDENEETSEVAEAMVPVVEALRFLSARVSTLEARIAAQDAPVDGAAWLAPAVELGSWTDVVAAHLAGCAPGGTVVHADCGEGALVRALTGRGIDALGVEPRGGVALRALENGCAVVITEVHEHLAALLPGTLGGIALSGVVDRLPLHAVLSLLVQCRRTLGRGAPIVIVSEPTAVAESRHAPAVDLVSGHPLHAETWELLLGRCGFGSVEPLRGAGGQDRRFALTAAVPR
jgi:hypothetical protein